MTGSASASTQTASTLWDEGEAGHYEAENYDQGLAGRILRHSHAVLEAPFGADRRFGRVLEVGAGSGIHVPYVRHNYDEYVLTDAHTAMLRESPQNIKAARHPQRVSVREENACRLSFADDGFDRLIASHVLEHLPQPEKVVVEWARVVRPGGTLSILLPCDPGVAWRAGRALGPRKRHEARGLPYDYVMALEHVNAITNLLAIIRHHFADRQERWWPLRIPSSDLNLIYAVHVRV